MPITCQRFIIKPPFCEGQQLPSSGLLIRWPYSSTYMHGQELERGYVAVSEEGTPQIQHPTFSMGIFCLPQRLTWLGQAPREEAIRHEFVPLDFLHRILDPPQQLLANRRLKDLIGFRKSLLRERRGPNNLRWEFWNIDLVFESPE
jgi:hypothetical protein